VAQELGDATNLSLATIQHILKPNTSALELEPLVWQRPSSSIKTPLSESHYTCRWPNTNHPKPGRHLMKPCLSTAWSLIVTWSPLSGTWLLLDFWWPQIVFRTPIAEPFTTPTPSPQYKWNRTPGSKYLRSSKHKTHCHPDLLYWLQYTSYIWKVPEDALSSTTG
jgi:hypothetical protein